MSFEDWIEIILTSREGVDDAWSHCRGGIIHRYVAKKATAPALLDCLREEDA